MTRVIRFYRAGDEYGCFSNFAPYPIEIAARKWPPSEHYSQAQEFAGVEHEETVRSAGSPMEAARMGRYRGRPLRQGWGAVKDDVMREAVRAKFRQHPRPRTILLATEAAILVEHTQKRLLLERRRGRRQEHARAHPREGPRRAGQHEPISA